MTQSQALAILKTGANVFLTGEPGSGKTHVINEYAAYLRARKIEPAITASTGLAATHIGGLTIHSWCGIGIKKKLEKRDLEKIASSGYIKKRVRRAKVLIIDEISMLLPGTLALIRSDKTIAEVAKMRGRTEGTILEHLESLFKLDKLTAQDIARLARGLEDLLPEIHAAFRDLDVEKLSPVFAKLAGKYSYNELRIARITYQGWG